MTTEQFRQKLKAYRQACELAESRHGFAGRDLEATLRDRIADDLVRDHAETEKQLAYESNRGMATEEYE